MGTADRVQTKLESLWLQEDSMLMGYRCQRKKDADRFHDTDSLTKGIQGLTLASLLLS